MNSLEPGNRLLLYLAGVLLILGLVHWFSLLVLSLILLAVIVYQQKAAGLFRSVLLILPFLITAALLGFFRVNGGLSFSLLLISKLLLIAIWNHYIFYNFGEGQLITGLNQLRVPSILTVIIFFIFSYHKLIKAELERLKTARILRGGRLENSRFSLQTYRTYGEIIGASLLRSLDRGDRVYQAMRLRGLKASGLVGGQDYRKLQWPGILITAFLVSIFIVLERGVL